MLLQNCRIMLRTLSQNHRITEWFELEASLKGPLVQLPAMGRDTFH